MLNISPIHIQNTLKFIQISLKVPDLWTHKHKIKVDYEHLRVFLYYILVSVQIVTKITLATFENCLFFKVLQNPLQLCVQITQVGGGIIISFVDQKAAQIAHVTGLWTLNLW